VHSAWGHGPERALFERLDETSEQLCDRSIERTRVTGPPVVADHMSP
jgi:hypothetical protein